MFVGPLATRPEPPHLATNSITPNQRFQLLRGPELFDLASFTLPSQYAVEHYPGRPKPPTPNFRHHLYQLTRFKFLHHLSLLSPTHHSFLPETLSPRQARPFKLSDGTTSADLRLYGPKVLAVPDRLSAVEYARLAVWMAKFAAAAGAGAGYDAMSWVAVDQVRQQGALCPELLDYVPE